jgi:uncharacterized membrane protein YkgB
MQDETFKSEEKVKILLAEYASLMSEIVARTGHGFQVSGFAITALAFLATAPSVTWRTILALTFIVLLLVGATFLTLRHVQLAAVRIREIERDVNRRAGENLMIWGISWPARRAYFLGPPNSN